MTPKLQTPTTRSNVFFNNQPSATEHSSHIDRYMAQEIISPFMLRGKSDSQSCRFIVDISWPKGASVIYAVKYNTYIEVCFLLTLPTIDHFIKVCYQI